MNQLAVKNRDTESPYQKHTPVLQRSRGRAELTFKKRDEDTVLDHLHQEGCCKTRFPNEGDLAQAILINTSGGLTDHDQMDVQVHWREGTRALVTSQAAEKIYKSRGAPAHIINNLKIDEDALALWVPQETILFEKGQVIRNLTADIAKGGSLLALESIMFGRTAMGESVHSGQMKDKWRIRYDDKLLFADCLSLEGNFQDQLNAPALLAGSKSCASFVYVGEDAEELARYISPQLNDTTSVSGLSQQGPLVVMRFLAEDAQVLRADIITILTELLAKFLPGSTADGADLLPRVWSC